MSMNAAARNARIALVAVGIVEAGAADTHT
jgi:hypothetical protein